MKVIYTDAAKAELPEFLKRQQFLLEEAIQARKHVLGDDHLEVTASDIKEIGNTIVPHFRQLQRVKLMRLVAAFYGVIGFGIMLYTGVYPYIKQAGFSTFFIVGAVTSLLGVVAYIYSRFIDFMPERLDRSSEKRADRVGVLPPKDVEFQDDKVRAYLEKRVAELETDMQTIQAALMGIHDYMLQIEQPKNEELQGRPAPSA